MKYNTIQYNTIPYNTIKQVTIKKKETKVSNIIQNKSKPKKAK